MKRFFMFVCDNLSPIVLSVCQILLLIISILVLLSCGSVNDFLCCFLIMYVYYACGYSLHDDTIPLVKRCVAKYREKKSTDQ